MCRKRKRFQAPQDIPKVCAIRSPQEVKALSKKQIPAFCEEVRATLIEQTLKGGGHLASNLGVVELTVAIHRVFDSPADHVIFDVGHQSYVHKLLTGRADRFDTLRAPGGLSGFPRREESSHDAFGTGHASTSLSAALGLAMADRLRGSDAYTVAVLGDGALTGGMIHEALNNCERDLRLIIVLNENEMSISKNVGRFARLLTKLRTSPGYFRVKTLLDAIFARIPLIGRPLKNGLRQIKNGIKRVLYRNNYFEALGLNYFGPCDGHDEQAVEQLLRSARAKQGCSIIHVKTVKGRGYAPAEQDPASYHGLGPADTPTREVTFSSTFGETLTALASEQPQLCAITAAMPQGTGLAPFAAAHPERFFDVGIAEEHAVTFAAGLSAGGMLPVVAIYSTFLQRSYDQILHDVALQRLPVLFAIDRAGLNAADGVTHHGIYDVAFLSEIPGLAIYEPLTTASLRAHLARLTEAPLSGPVALRYPSGGDAPDILSHLARPEVRELCQGSYADFDPASPPATVIVTYGRLSATVLKAAAAAPTPVGTLLTEQLRPRTPLVELLADLAEKGTQTFLFCEEGIRSGGLGMHLADELRDRLPAPGSVELHILAIDNETLAPQSANSAPDTAAPSPLDVAGIGEDAILRYLK